MFCPSTSQSYKSVEEDADQISRIHNCRYSLWELKNSTQQQSRFEQVYSWIYQILEPPLWQWQKQLPTENTYIKFFANFDVRCDVLSFQPTGESYIWLCVNFQLCCDILVFEWCGHISKESISTLCTTSSKGLHDTNTKTCQTSTKRNCKECRQRSSKMLYSRVIIEQF